jgi:threonine/homoserine/homoserine lactone efflux protein
MFHIFVEGFLWGLIISFSFGPAFFTIIQTGIDRGFKPAIYMALGILTCDFFLILLCFLGLSNIYESEKNKLYIGFIGGIVLIIYGTYTFLKKPDILKRRSPKYKTPDKIQKHIKYVAKGFFLNIANPFVVLIWLTAMIGVKAQSEPGKLLNYCVFFFSGALMTIFGIDVLKSFVGNKIKKYLRPRIQLRINHITGILLVIFGIILMIRVKWAL